MPRKILRELVIFLAFVALTIAFTWPMAIRLSTLVSDLGDPLLNAWILNWDQFAWTHGRAVFQAPIFHPAKFPLAYSENLFGIALVTLPFHLLGLSPMTVHNIAMMLGFAFSGYGASVLARTVSRSTTAGMICGALFAFCPYRFDHLPHLQIIWSGWLPLILAGLIHYWREPRPRNAAFFAAALLMNGLTNIHWLLFGTTAAGLAALMLFVIGPRRPFRFWLDLGVAMAVALALLVPVLMPYKTVNKLYGMKRDRAEVMEGSADWADWLQSSERNRTWGMLPGRHAFPERLLWPALLPLLLTAGTIVLFRNEERGTMNDEGPPPTGRLDSSFIVHPSSFRRLLRSLDVLIVLCLIAAYAGTVADRYQLRLFGKLILSLNSGDVPFVLALALVITRLTLAFPRAWRGARTLREAAAASRFPLEVWLGFLWVAVGVFGSFGLKGFLHTFLYNRVQAFHSIRCPSRWAMIAYVGLVATGAPAIAALLRERAGRARAFVITALTVATFFDLRTRVIWENDLAGPEPVYRWLAATKEKGPILELPMDDLWIEYFYTARNAWHHATTFNGVSGFFPPEHGKISDMTAHHPLPDELLPLLEAAGGRLVVIHEDWLREHGAATHDWLRRETARGRLQFLRRLDHGIGGDWVFALPGNVPDWPALRDSARDGAGRTPDDELAALLANQPTYSQSTFGRVDTPAYESEVHGALTVGGWALSPDGIAAVDLLFENGRVRIPADLVARGDVQALYPWYPAVAKPGFQKVITRKPKGARTDTDMQVEITDGKGRRFRLPDMMLHWK
jgi:hypothetical protein